MWGRDWNIWYMLSYDDHDIVAVIEKCMFW